MIAVSNDVSLAHKCSANGVSITWSSSATNVIATDGMVNRPHFTNGDQSVLLTASLFKGMVTNTKTFTLTVIALAITDADAVSNASNTLEISYTVGETSNAVSNDVSLATNALNGVSITWSSSATNVIATDGMVSRPHYTNGDQSVLLTASLFKGMVTNTKTFTLTVIALPITDADAVSNASNTLEISYTVGETSNAVSNDVSLATNALNGVSITWSSSATNVIATNGMVSRPHYTNGDQSVLLTASLFKGMVTNTKTFTLTVIALPITKMPMPSRMQAIPWRSAIQGRRLQMPFPMM